MILFLYGSDTYRSHQKLNDIKKKYIDASLGDVNLTVADCSDKNLDYTQIIRMISAMPFLAKSRLVIVNNLLSKGPKNLQEKISDYLSKIPSTTNLIFYEDEKIDKRSSLYKKLSKKGGEIKSQEFKLLSDYELRNWIKKKVESQGATIEPPAIEKLILYVGSDLWRMSNEIQKVTSYKLQVTSENIKLLVRPKITANVFELVDALGKSDLRKSQQELHKLLDIGEHELYILTMIVYQFRNLLIIKDFLSNLNLVTRDSNSSYKLRSSNYNSQIAKESGLHPFVVSKTMAQCQNFTLDQLKKIYQKLLDYDIKIKTGELNSKLALDILVVELCNNR